LTPLRFGSPSSFSNVRAFLEDSGYTERAVCQRLDLTAPHEALSRGAPEESQPIHDSVDLLIRFFLEGACVDIDTLRSFVPAKALESMTELGLVMELVSRENLYYAPVSLYPVGDLYIASDRWTNPDKSPFVPQPDIVYPAITKNTYRFLGTLPSKPCARFLDLCSGTGIGALAAAAGRAEWAWAVDVTERSTGFGEFNRLLNGADNVTVLQGDLYEPVRGLAFDRIVAHPPYVPASSAKWIFQDAGLEGEDITRRIVAGLPDHLAAGGRLYCLSLGADHKNEPLERRVRYWLGEHEARFDVMLVSLNTHKPSEIASQPLLRGAINHQEFVARRAAFEEAGIEGFAYGLLVVQALEDDSRPVFTARRQAGPATGSSEFEWALRWESAAASPSAAALLLNSRPLVSKRLEMRVLHRVENGALAPQELVFQTEYPFNMECRVQPWTAALVGICDGARTGADLHRYCGERGWIAPHVPAEDFAGFLGSLVSGGFIEIEGFAPPVAA